MQARSLKSSAATGWLSGELGRFRARRLNGRLPSLLDRRDGHFKKCRAFVCGNDSDATVWAKQLVDGCDIELWNGARVITRISHKADSDAAVGGIDLANISSEGSVR
jgi:hypothetical protein